MGKDQDDFFEEEGSNKLDAYALSYSDTCWDDSSWIRDIYYQDYIDSLGIDSRLAVDTSENPLEWISDPANDDQGWKDRTNIGALKTRSKQITLFSQFLQAYKQNSTFPMSCEPTTHSDAEELLQKVMSEAESVPEELINQFHKMEEDGVKIQEKMLLDQLEECEFNSKIVPDVFEYGTTFGSCVLESPYEEEEIAFSPTPIPLLENGQLVGFSPSPGFHKKTKLKMRVLAPWSIALDPEANGNPQDGKGLVTIRYIDTIEATEFKKMERFDPDAIDKVLDKLKENEDDDSSESGEFEMSDEGDDTKSERYMGLTGNYTKPIEFRTIYLNVTYEQLKRWPDQEDLLSELLEDEYYSEYDENGFAQFDENDRPIIHEDTCFKLHLIYFNRVRVYTSPLNTIDRKRPIHFHGLHHVKGTNYFMGVYALAREINKILNKTWQRGMNNAELVGTTIFGVVEDVLDSDEMPFAPGASWGIDFKSMASLGMSNVNQAVQQFKFQSTSQELMQFHNFGDMLLDETTMTPKNLSGVSATDDQTATEITQNLSSAQVIILSWLKGFDRRLFIPAIESMRNYMIVNDFFPREARVSVRIKVMGADTFSNQVINKRRILELIQTIPMFLERRPEIDLRFKWDELIVKYLVSLGYEEQDVLHDPQTFSIVSMLNQRIGELEQMHQQMTAQLQDAIAKLQKSGEDLQAKELEIEKQKMINSEIKAGAKKLAQDTKRDLEKLVKITKLETENQKLKQELAQGQPQENLNV